MSDGYQVGVLSLVNVCLKNIYGVNYTSAMSTRLGNSMFVGIVLGQVQSPFLINTTETHAAQRAHDHFGQLVSQAQPKLFSF